MPDFCLRLSLLLYKLNLWLFDMSKIKQAIIGIPCDAFLKGQQPFNGVGVKYINAISNGSQGLPFLIPAYPAGIPLDLESATAIVEKLDGLFLTGSPSNVQPSLYGNEVSDTPDQHDPYRDNVTFPLIHAAIAAKTPILGVCRGIQELNVALGGTLYQQVHNVSGMSDHRENKESTLEQQYAAAHSVSLVKNGILRKIANSDTVMVNSLHGQGIKSLGKSLRIEATAEDGLVEAFSLDSDEQFLLGIQWHPEWQFEQNVFSTAIFKTFGDVVRASM